MPHKRRLKTKPRKYSTTQEQDFKIALKSSLGDFLEFAEKKPLLWKDITPNNLVHYSLLYMWYRLQGRILMESLLMEDKVNLFLKDVYSDYKLFILELHGEPLGNITYLRYLKKIISNLDTKKHCVGTRLVLLQAF